jgi:hypothetical protein
VNAPWMTTLIKLFKSNLTVCVICVFNLQVDDRLTSGAFTIYTSVPTLTGNLIKTDIQGDFEDCADI